MSHMRAKLSLPVVSAIIERVNEGKTQILVQTRWKPGKDLLYSGTLELAAGCVEEYEDVYEALRREVLEETGLTVKRFVSDSRTKAYTTDKGDESFGFVPFCCYQQMKQGYPWVGFAFLCEVEDSEPKPQREEVKDVRWMDADELRKIFTDTPEKIFTLQLGILDYYFRDWA